MFPPAKPVGNEASINTFIRFGTVLNAHEYKVSSTVSPELKSSKLREVNFSLEKYFLDLFIINA